MQRTHRRLYSVFPCAVLLTACSSIELSGDHYDNVFAIGKDGQSAVDEIDGARVDDPSFDGQLDAVLGSLDVHLADPEQEKRVLLFFHGGMNSLSGGCGNAKDHLARLQKANSKLYPIFVNWDSGPISSWRVGLFSTVQGRINRLPAFLSSPFRSIAAIGRALTRTPETLLWQGVRNTAELGGIDVQPIPDGWDAQVTDSADTPRVSVVRGITSLVPGVLRIATTPLVDTWGVTAYSDMRRTAHLAFVREEAKWYDPNIRAKAGDFQPGVLSKLADELVALHGQKQHGDLRITVVAHSMGAHIANELLRRYPALPVDRIVYLAPACSIREFASTALEFVKHSVEEGASVPCDFYCVMLHPHREATERIGWGFLPHGTLLVWVDEYLSRHFSVEERTLGAWNNAMRALPTLQVEDAVRERLHFEMIPWGDDEIRTHGAVDNVEFWKFGLPEG